MEARAEIGASNSPARPNHFRSAGSGEVGLGLVEIVICIFLIGLLTISFLPLFMQAMQMSTRNATTASATQVANEQLEIARITSATCEAFTAPITASVVGYKYVTPPVVEDARGNKYKATRNVSSCPSVYPGVIQVSISVVKVGVTGPLAEATTYIRLLAAG